MITILRLLVLFARHCYGTVHRPYETYRQLSKGTDLFQAIPLFLLVGGYFVFAALIQKGLHTHPLFLTLSAGKLVTGFVMSSAVVLGLFWLLGKLAGGTGSIKTLLLPWSYSLLPTLIWFLATSIFYILLPPPRTPSLPGQIFSIVFLIFSFFLFFWKLVLYYLTLRFGMRLTFMRIIGVSAVLFPTLFLYSIGLYRMGIFKVPFI